MPTQVKPMLATLVSEPFDRPGWLFEIKWDGYRAIAEVMKRGVRLYSRNQLSFNTVYGRIARALERLEHEAVLDGEIVVLDEQGKADFQSLQNYQRSAEGRLVYYVFDLLYLDGHDLRALALIRRKALLKQILPEGPAIRLSEHVEEHGVAFFHAAGKQGLEGIIAKEANSRYEPGRRSKQWLKIKTSMRQEAVIGGYTLGRGGRKGFGALVLGVYEDDKLIYVGHTGTGFNADTLADMYARLARLTQPECPFAVRPATNQPARWVQPSLVCEVRFSQWTADGSMRHPVYVGLREDKPAQEVRRERPSRPPRA